MEIYLVGGVVRDEQLGISNEKSVKDFKNGKKKCFNVSSRPSYEGNSW